MAITVNCDQCHKTFRVKDHYAGLTGRCPYCSEMVMVPDPTPEMVRNGSEIEVTYEETNEEGTTTTSSLSLVTEVPKRACPQCNKPNLVGTPNCYYCSAALF